MLVEIQVPPFGMPRHCVASARRIYQEELRMIARGSTNIRVAAPLSTLMNMELWRCCCGPDISNSHLR